MSLLTSQMTYSILSKFSNFSITSWALKDQQPLHYCCRKISLSSQPPDFSEILLVEYLGRQWWKRGDSKVDKENNYVYHDSPEENWKAKLKFYWHKMLQDECELAHLQLSTPIKILKFASLLFPRHLWKLFLVFTVKLSILLQFEV